MSADRNYCAIMLVSGNEKGRFYAEEAPAPF